MSSCCRLPDFFTQYLSPNSEGLPIPPAFVQHLNGALPKDVVLSNHEGKMWSVKMVWVDGMVVFMDGWRGFICDNFVVCGDLLVFTYDGRSGFHVKIFGRSAVEKMESNDCKTALTEVVNLDKDKEIKETCEIIETNKEGGSKKRASVKLEQIDVSKYIQPCDPHFFVKLKVSGHMNQLQVPAKVLELHKLELPDRMIFENKHGHKWLEKTSRWNDGRTMIGGWNNFCKVNDIYPDDVCLCALLPDRKGQKVNTVKVWKINDAGSSPDWSTTLMSKRKLGHDSNPTPVDTNSPSSDSISTFSCKRSKEGVTAAVNEPKRRRVKGNNAASKEPKKKGVKGKNAVSKRSKKGLTDEEFECYLENLWTSLSEDKKTHFTRLDSLWFHLYQEASSKESVLIWIKQKKIFSKKYVIVPIVCWGHWSLLIFCHFGENMQSETRKPCMLLLDSLEMADPRRLEPDIRRLALDVYRAENRPETEESILNIPLLVPKVPQQRDDRECGNFVLYFIKLFVEAAPEDFTMENYPYFMSKDWFSPEDLDIYFEKLNEIPMEIESDSV